MNIGFIGIGGMGAAMVPNLVRARHQGSVWNRSAPATTALADVTVGHRKGNLAHTFLRCNL